ncbi:flagellin [Jannaschia sp. AI_61]|nr:flagellin [Jannaschia sp. AI_61]
MEAVRSDIASIAQNSTDFGTYLADVTAYFDAGGAFETTIVSSYASEQATFPGRDGKSFGVDLDARSAGLKEAIANAAVLSGMRHVGFDVSELVKSSAASMLLTRASAADADVSTMQAQVGVLEERISDDREAAVSERLDAEKRLSDLVGIDEYDVATRLNAELSRLEAAYAITARRSQLRLTNFL